MRGFWAVFIFTSSAAPVVISPFHTSITVSHVNIFLDLIHNGCAVHLRHSGIALVHVYKTDKTQDTDHQAKVEASACLLFLSPLHYDTDHDRSCRIWGERRGYPCVHRTVSLSAEEALCGAFPNHSYIASILPSDLFPRSAPYPFTHVFRFRCTDKRQIHTVLSATISYVSASSLRTGQLPVSYLVISSLLSVCELICDIFPCHAPLHHKHHCVIKEV